MKTCKEIRAEAWKRLLGGDGMRIFGSGFALGLVSMVILMGIGLVCFSDLETPITENAFANLMLQLLGAVFGGIMSFGIAAASLKKGAWGGFKCPISCGWLKFLSDFILGILFVCLIVPGIWAYYVISMRWFVKAENPELGAMASIRKSSQLMKGHKWQLFKLHCSYWASVCVVGLAVIAMELAVALGSLGLAFALLPVVLILIVGESIYLLLGNVVFYEQLKGAVI